MPVRRSLVAVLLSLVTGGRAARSRRAPPAPAHDRGPGCGGVTTPSWPAPGQGPARMLLRAPSGACRAADRLGYGWSGDGYAVCADGAASFCPAPPLPLAVGEAAAIHADHLGRIEWLRFRIRPGAAPSPARDWEPTPTPRRPVHRQRVRLPAGPVPLPADLPSGVSVVEVEARVRGRCGGSTAQSFPIEAGAGFDPAATPAAATPVASE